MNENVKSLIDEKDEKENNEISANHAEIEEINSITNVAEEETEAEEIKDEQEKLIYNLKGFIQKIKKNLNEVVMGEKIAQSH